MSTSEWEKGILPALMVVNQTMSSIAFNSSILHCRNTPNTPEQDGAASCQPQVAVHDTIAIADHKVGRMEGVECSAILEDSLPPKIGSITDESVKLKIEELIV